MNSNSTVDRSAVWLSLSGTPRKERRHHRLFITRNTEYHLVDGRVVAVRTRGQEAFDKAHDALGMVNLYGHELLGPGHRLWLSSTNSSGQMVMTSPVVSIERPALAVVKQYLSHSSVEAPAP